jgi:hydroxymethylpyrimidine/phosphomethylpyrimidine kinase
LVSIALTIAGSDPSGGAGIQADLKTFHRFGVYGQAVVTLLTVQNTRRVSRVVVMDPDLVIEQIRAVLDDVPPAAAKLGALGNSEVVHAVARESETWTFPLVIDPVMISKHGSLLLGEAGSRAIRELLVPRAFLITPNIPEAEALTGEQEPRAAASRLRTAGARNVLVKGGHLPGDAVDLLLTEGGDFHEFQAARIETPHTHGTGCTYSAAITALLAQSVELVEAVGIAKKYVTEAIRTAPGLGHGSGPLNHWA